MINNSPSRPILTVLQMSKSENEFDIAKFVIEKGMNITAQDIRGRNVFFIIFSYITKFQIKCKNHRAISQKIKEGQNALHVLTVFY